MHILLTILFIFIVGSSSFAQGVLVNEYSTANLSTLADEDGKFPDWLELYNSSSSPISLSGWSIDDDPSDPIPWSLPPIQLNAFGHLLLFASGEDKGQLAPFNETVIQPGDSCRYLVPTAEPTLGWFWPDIDDSGWLRGRLSLGYGDGDDTTIVPATTSLYIRADFNVENIEAVRYAILHVDYDDGFVAYVNGAEIARANMDGYPPRYDSTSIDDHEAQMWGGGNPEMFFIPGIDEFIRPGRNVLSIQVHNSDPASTDLSIIPFLTMGLESAPTNPRGIASVLEGFLLQMHTNFKLAAGGDTLILRDGTGAIIDQVTVEEMPEDMSRGRAPDGSGNWRIFSTPTPGEANPVTGALFTSPRPTILPEAGFYSNSFQVTLGNDSAQAEIYYTLDGSPPTVLSLLYTAPFRLDTSTVVRAISRIPGEIESADRTSSFIIGPRPTLPVVSISMNPVDLWDPETGIYVLGPTYDPDPPYRGANFWQPWERPAHAEMFETDGSEAFELDAGIKIHGGWTRSFPQKSMRIMARSKYGAGNIACQIFPESNIDQFESIVLRNGGSDWDHAMFRDGLLTGLVRDVYPYISAYRPSIVYLNGAYWGILNLREQLNERYVASHLEVDAAEVDAFEVWGEKISGEWTDYEQMVNFFETHDLSDPANYRMAEELIDADEFALYNAVNIYVDNGDWPGNNHRFFRVRQPGEKWHWFLLDLDFGFGLHGENAWEHNSLADALASDGADWPNPAYATLYLRKMCQNPAFRAKFINTFADLMNFEFEPANVLNHVAQKRGALLPEIERHLVRWERTVAEWQDRVDEITPFAQNRPAFMRQHVQAQFGLPGSALLTLNCNPPAGGDIQVNGRKISSVGWTGTYFRTIPLTIEAIPEPGYRFVGWTGGSSSTQPKLTLALDADRAITALFALAPGIVGIPVINEINYNSLDSFDTGDWVELTAFNGYVDLSGWTLCDEDTAHRYTIPNATTILDREFLIFVEDTAKFDSLFPNVPNRIGNLTFGLGRGGDQIKLYSPRGELIDSVLFDDVPPWPVEADGLGATLELIDPTFPNDDSTSWRASIELHGSPSLSNQYNPPNPFSLLSPPDEYVSRFDSVKVMWSRALDDDPGDTVFYTVEWSLHSDFSQAFDTTTTDTVFYISENPVLTTSLSRGIARIPDRTEIFWRVSARDTRNFTLTSSEGDSGWSFRVQKLILPTEFAIRPVFPNPFNTRVAVVIDVAEAGEIEVAFYDLVGRLVDRQSGSYAPGSHRFFFPPDSKPDLASGIYWVQATQGDLSRLTKLVLVR